MADVRDTLYSFDAGILRKDACVVIVYTEWNEAVVGKLLKGCLEVLRKYEMNNVKILKVPGAFEIPFAVKKCWDTYQNKFEKPEVFISLGCVIRGGTPHFDYVCKAVTEGVVALNISLPVPVIFGVLTVDDEQQALDRAGGSHGNKGAEAAYTALKMLAINYSFT